ncbi:hypothetical protein VM98_35025, partial [Streptomyces rubellomurinus subsp. indigoferus]
VQRDHRGRHHVVRHRQGDVGAQIGALHRLGVGGRDHVADQGAHARRVVADDHRGTADRRVRGGEDGDPLEVVLARRV